MLMQPFLENMRRLVDAAYRGLSRLFSVVWYDLSWRFAPPGTFRQRFEQAIVNMPQGICLYDAQDRLQLVNEQFCRIYSQPISTLRMGMRFYDILANSCAVGNYPGRPSRTFTGSANRISTSAGRTPFFRNLETAG
jgi:PAS domain-containing protein